MKEKAQGKKEENVQKGRGEEKPEGGNVDVGVVERGDKPSEGGAGYGGDGASVQRPPADS